MRRENDRGLKAQLPIPANNRQKKDSEPAENGKGGGQKDQSEQTGMQRGEQQERNKRGVGQDLIP